jgi:hypothetical protein
MQMKVRFSMVNKQHINGCNMHLSIQFPDFTFEVGAPFPFLVVFRLETIPGHLFRNRSFDLHQALTLGIAGHGMGVRQHHVINVVAVDGQQFTDCVDVEVYELSPIVCVPSLRHDHPIPECLQQPQCDFWGLLGFESFCPHVLGEVIEDGQNPEVPFGILHTKGTHEFIWCVSVVVRMWSGDSLGHRTWSGRT